MEQLIVKKERFTESAIVVIVVVDNAQREAKGVVEGNDIK